MGNYHRPDPGWVQSRGVPSERRFFDGRHWYNDTTRPVNPNPVIWIRRVMRTGMWQYFNTSDGGYIDMPNVHSLEEAQATALAIWKMRTP